jgi:deoxyribodipyrimidine photolyase
VAERSSDGTPKASGGRLDAPAEARPVSEWFEHGVVWLRIVQFFFDALTALRTQLRGLGSDLVLLEGDMAGELVRFARDRSVQALERGGADRPESRRAPETTGMLRRRTIRAAGATSQRRCSTRSRAARSARTPMRALPAARGTSRLSPHLRAGTLGIRACVAAAQAAGADTWLGELIWRDYPARIVDHAQARERARALGRK